MGKPNGVGRAGTPRLPTCRSPKTGKGLARALKGHLSPQDFGLILSSPRRRARETAELAGFVGAYEPQIDNDLAEWFYGDYEGKTSPEIWKRDLGLDDLER